MTGHAGGGGAVMRNADGSDMSKSDVLVRRRGAFKWLPVYFSNDLVHGSWWFVFGSAAMTLFSIVPLVQKYIGLYDQHDDLLPDTDFTITWTLMAFSGFFFTLGSGAFVHAFEEPTKRPIFWYNKHFQTDELLGAWLFLWGTVPGVPYTLVFLIVDPSSVFLGAVGISIVMVFGSLLFVVACYPSDKKRNNYVLPWCLRYCGANMWVVKHLANDWLAGTWFFLIANEIACFISFVMLFEACATGNQESIFIWFSGSVEAFLFLVGSLYFVAGSYPHASQFYYAAGRNATGQTFEEAQGIVKSQIDVEKKRETHVPTVDLGIGKKGSLAAQRMEGRVTIKPAIVNPLHRGAGGKLGGYSPISTPKASTDNLGKMAAAGEEEAAVNPAVNPLHAPIPLPLPLPLPLPADEDDDEYEEETDDDEETGPTAVKK